MWKYISENVSGNLHDAARYLNTIVVKEHPVHEVVCMTSSGYNSIVVYRIPITH